MKRGRMVRRGVVQYFLQLLVGGFFEVVLSQCQLEVNWKAHCQPGSGWRPPGPVIGAAPFLEHLEIASQNHL